MSRRTKAQMETFRNAIYDIVETNQPCSARQVYYRGVGSLWPKDTSGSRTYYNDVVRNLGIMRETGMLPWSWIVDGTRRVRIDTMYDSIEDAAQRWAESYRRDLWSLQPIRVEVWCESDSIADTIDPITRALGVGLYPCRGQSAKAFAYNTATVYDRIRKPVTIVYLGDWDPSGLAVPRSLEERLHRYSNGETEIDFVRLAVTADDVASGRYETHDVNRKDNNYRRFVEQCRLVELAPDVAVETEAIAANDLRDRVEEAIYDLVVDVESWNSTIAAERSELEVVARMLGGAA